MVGSKSGYGMGIVTIVCMQERRLEGQCRQQVSQMVAVGCASEAVVRVRVRELILAGGGMLQFHSVD